MKTAAEYAKLAETCAEDSDGRYLADAQVYATLAVAAAVTASLAVAAAALEHVEHPAVGCTLEDHGIMFGDGPAR